MQIHLPFPEVYATLRMQLPPDTGLYLVGGCVRDILLGRDPKDLDFVTDGDTRKLARAAANQFDGGVYEMDAERHTFRVLLDDGGDGKAWVLDISQLRGETIEDDLGSRDFTINAMAIDVTKESTLCLVDPLDGQTHLQQSLMLACGTESMQSDPIRVLRGIRLALELNFTLAESTQTLMKASASLLTKISGERIREEWIRMMAAPTASQGLEWLRQLGALETIFPLPEQNGGEPFLFGVWDGWSDQLRNFDCIDTIYRHQFDWIDTKNEWIASDEQIALEIRQYGDDCLTADHPRISLIKSAALMMYFQKLGILHDPKSALKFWGERLALSQKENRFLQQIVIHQHLVGDLEQKFRALDRKSIYRFFKAAEEVGIALCILALADRLSLASRTQKNQPLARLQGICRQLMEAYWWKKNKMVTPELFLSGDDLQSIFGLPPGRQIGHLLELLREAQAEGKIRSREEAINYIQLSI